VQTPFVQVPPPVQGMPLTGLHLCFLHFWHSGQGLCLVHRAASAGGPAIPSSPATASATARRRDAREPTMRVMASKRSASIADLQRRLRAAMKARHQVGAEFHRRLCCCCKHYTPITQQPDGDMPHSRSRSPRAIRRDTSDAVFGCVSITRYPSLAFRWRHVRSMAVSRADHPLNVLPSPQRPTASTLAG
jgi:hypothetical protein